MTWELIRNADVQAHASPPREDSAPCHDLLVIGVQVESGEALVERTRGRGYRNAGYLRKRRAGYFFTSEFSTL